VSRINSTTSDLESPSGTSSASSSVGLGEINHLAQEETFTPSTPMTTSQLDAQIVKKDFSDITTSHTELSCNSQMSDCILSTENSEKALLQHVRDLEQKLNHVNEEFSRMSADQEDLFVALAEKQLTINQLKEQLGVPPSSEEEDDEE